MSLFEPTWDFELQPDTVEAFDNVKVYQHGGPQDLILLVRARKTPDNRVRFEDDELIKLSDYAYDYGTGGYQTAFRLLQRDARAAGWRAPEHEHETTRPDQVGRRWDGQ